MDAIVERSLRIRLSCICMLMFLAEFTHSLQAQHWPSELPELPKLPKPPDLPELPKPPELPELPKPPDPPELPELPAPPEPPTPPRQPIGPLHPNILYIIADDFGFGDVGYHNSDMITPNIDAFAKEGVRLENFYTQPVCSATRASILTGRYVHRLGFQHFNPPKARGGVGGVPLSEKLLPEYLKDAGYSTHLIGKWHAGMLKEAYLPQHRGFDTHFGFYEGGIRYYNHTIGSYDDLHYAFAGSEQICMPFFKGIYDLDLFTAAAVKTIDFHNPHIGPLFLVLSYHSVHAPNESPPEFYNMYPNVVDEARRVYSGMVSAMDKAIGITINRWRSKDEAFWKNSIIIFHSDNGGSMKLGSMNFPLRGGKLSLFEGGMRVNAFVLSPLIARTNRIETGLLHITDILPTLVGRFAGEDLTKGKKLDGMDVWDTISHGVPSPRTEIVHQIDPLGNAEFNEFGPEIWGCETSGHFYGRRGRCQLSAAIRKRNWKLIVGMYAACTLNVSNFIACGRYQHQENYSEPNFDVDSLAFIKDSDNNELAVTLFDIESDPYELVNVAKQHPDIIDILMRRIKASGNSEWMDPQWPPYQVCDTPNRDCNYRFDLYNASNFSKGCINPFVPDYLPADAVKPQVEFPFNVADLMNDDWE